MSDGINKPLDEQEPRPIPFITPEYVDSFDFKELPASLETDLSKRRKSPRQTEPAR